MIRADQLETLLNRWPVARLATGDSAGQPHLVPIVFCTHDGRILSPIDGKPKASSRLKRIDNIRANPAVSLLLDHYDEAWEALWWVRVDGLATLTRPNAAQTAEVQASLQSKYPQYSKTAVFHGEPLLIDIQPQQVRSWAPRGFDAVLEGISS